MRNHSIGARRGSERGLIIAATESDFVYALDAATGHIVWRSSVGRPVPRAALPCGNIDPLGITGTPVIDATRGTVLLRCDERRQRHAAARRLWSAACRRQRAARLSDRRCRRARHARHQFQPARAKPARRAGTAEWPYLRAVRRALRRLRRLSWRGRRSRRFDPPQVLGAWITRASKGGIWAPAGLSEADGSLYFATGNTEGARAWGDGEGVFRVGPDLAHPVGPPDFFAPSNWKQLDDDDLDLSGVTPLPLAVPGSPIPLMLALGKDGNAYLLDRASLGGIGGALASPSGGARRDHHRRGGLYGGRCGVGRLPGAWCFVPERRLCLGHRGARGDGGDWQQAAYCLVCPAGRPRRSDRHNHGRQLGTDRLGGWRGGRRSAARFPRRYRRSDIRRGLGRATA